MRAAARRLTRPTATASTQSTPHKPRAQGRASPLWFQLTTSSRTTRHGAQPRDGYFTAHALRNAPLQAKLTVSQPGDVLEEEADRTAVVLRFYEQQDFRSVGQAIGSNEDAARMLVNRALEKLESLLKRRGVTTTGAVVGAMLTANAVQSAPVGLAVAISGVAHCSGKGADRTGGIDFANHRVQRVGDVNV